MRLIVTGNAGFIGSHFFKYILRNYPEYRVVGVDLFTSVSSRENLLGVGSFLGNEGTNFINICDYDNMKVLVDDFEPDSIVNFAASTFVDKSIENSKEFYDTNVEGVRVLCELCRRSKKNLKKLRLVQISTDEVYGSIPQGYAKETSNLNPSNPYAASKAAADLLALSYFKTYGIDVVITRSTNNYGTHQHPEKFIPHFITNILKGLTFPVYGDGTAVRDWLHVHDNCRAIDLVLHKGVSGEVYNIGGSNLRTNLEVLKILASIMSVNLESCIRSVGDRPAHDLRYAVDRTKIQRELGWYPIKNNFEDGLSDVVQWYKENQDWWKNKLVFDYSYGAS